MQASQSDGLSRPKALTSRKYPLSDVRDNNSFRPQTLASREHLLSDVRDSNLSPVHRRWCLVNTQCPRF